MTNDPCARHETREATNVAMVTTTTGRAVYRLCDECAADYPSARPLPTRVDVPTRKEKAA